MKQKVILLLIVWPLLSTAIYAQVEEKNPWKTVEVRKHHTVVPANHQKTEPETISKKDMPPKKDTTQDVVKAKAPLEAVAVDLGLPSGTLWANMNVGAQFPEEHGLCFAWGDTNGNNYWTASFKKETHKWGWRKDEQGHLGKHYGGITKYCVNPKFGEVDGKTVLELSDDAARANWGGPWRMPTVEEVKELKRYTKRKKTKLNGEKFIKCISKINGNFIYFPLNYRTFKPYLDKTITEIINDSFYWTSTLRQFEYESDSSEAEGFRVEYSSDDYYSLFISKHERYTGFYIRPVQGK